MNTHAATQYAPGIPVLDPRGRFGAIAEVKQATGSVMMIGAGGLTRVHHDIAIVWDDGTISPGLSEGIVTPWVINARNSGYGPVLNHAEQYEAAQKAQTERRRQLLEMQEDGRRQRAEFEADAAGRIPANAKAVIIAELERDVSDSMTDYFNAKTVRTVILGFSTHSRDLFPELRKAAANFAETAHLVDAPASAEHRQKYSMGAGYFLKATGRYSDGWKISKKRFYGDAEPAKQVPTGEWSLATVAQAAPPASDPATGEIRIEEHTHTKRGFQMFICIMPARVDREEFDRLRSAAEALGGWYSKPWGKTPGGFAFKREADAQAFANAEPSETTEAQPDAMPRTNPATADKLRALADKLQGDIDHKLGARLTNTPKRQREAASARQEGTRLQRTQKAMRALADLHEAGTVPPILATLTTKAAVYDLAGSHIDRTNAGYYDAGIDTGKPSLATPAALALWELIGGPSDAERRADELRRKVEALQFANIPGYFPTPAAIIADMIDAADIGGGPVTILEPSAGSGAILDAVHKAHPDALLYSYELHASLREVLKLKGYQPHGSDFMEAHPEPIWDFVLMNPPFENGQDMAHVRHAFDMLKPGGRLVAIMSPGPFFRQDRKAQAFRDWFDDMAADKVDIPAGAFKASGTGIATVMVTITKPEA